MPCAVAQSLNDCAVTVRVATELVTVLYGIRHRNAVSTACACVTLFRVSVDPVCPDSGFPLNSH